jgi:hypothetical protein
VLEFLDDVLRNTLCFVWLIEPEGRHEWLYGGSDRFAASPQDSASADRIAADVLAYLER